MAPAPPGSGCRRTLPSLLTAECSSFVAPAGALSLRCVARPSRSWASARACASGAAPASCKAPHPRTRHAASPTSTAPAIRAEARPTAGLRGGMVGKRLRGASMAPPWTGGQSAKGAPCSPGQPACCGCWRRQRRQPSSTLLHEDKARRWPVRDDAAKPNQVKSIQGRSCGLRQNCGQVTSVTGCEHDFI